MKRIMRKTAEIEYIKGDVFTREILGDGSEGKFIALPNEMTLTMAIAKLDNLTNTNNKFYLAI